MKLKDRVLGIVEGLKKEYPQAERSLNYDEPYQLLFATRLSAQCTDARVNIVTKELYSKYKTLSEIAECDIEDLERIVHPCGVFRMKARDIRAAANMLIEKFGDLNIEFVVVNPTAGAHCGPSCVGVSFRSKSRLN
jgi:endonuclease-3